MKYIIMKAQEARKFEDLGGLTITKQFKPAPPYIEGASLEQMDGGNWRLVDDTGRPIEGEDGAADVFVPPVQSGDVVYIHEPWIRLKNPDGSPSDRIRLAADSVVSEGQQACKQSQKKQRRRRKHPACLFPSRRSLKVLIMIHTTGA